MSRPTGRAAGSGSCATRGAPTGSPPSTSAAGGQGWRRPSRPSRSGWWSRSAARCRRAFCAWLASTGCGSAPRPPPRSAMASSAATVRPARRRGGKHMVSQTDASGNHGLQPHRSYWPIALALLGLVVGLLGTAVILDRQLRPRVGIEPLPAVRVEEAPTTAQPAAAPATMATGLPAEDGPSAPQLEEEVEQAY